MTSEKEFDTKGEFNLLSYDSNHSKWKKLLDYFWYKNYDTSEVHYDVEPIYEVKSSDLIGNVSKNLLINEKDVSHIKELYAKNIIAGKTTYLFRYANNTYFSNEITVIDKWITIPKTDTAYMFQQSMFIDFEILTLGFF